MMKGIPFMCCEAWGCFSWDMSVFFDRASTHCVLVAPHFVRCQWCVWKYRFTQGDPSSRTTVVTLSPIYATALFEPPFSSWNLFPKYESLKVQCQTKWLASLWDDPCKRYYRGAKFGRLGLFGWICWRLIVFQLIHLPSLVDFYGKLVVPMEYIPSFPNTLWGSVFGPPNPPKRRPWLGVPSHLQTWGVWII